MKEDIRHVNVTEAVQDYALLRGQRSEKDDIHIFTQLFEAAAKSYAERIGGSRGECILRSLGRS